MLDDKDWILAAEFLPTEFMPNSANNWIDAEFGMTTEMMPTEMMPIQQFGINSVGIISVGIISVGIKFSASIQSASFQSFGCYGVC